MSLVYSACDLSAAKDVHMTMTMLPIAPRISGQHDIVSNKAVKQHSMQASMMIWGMIL